jgi:hypothetical protein
MLTSEVKMQVTVTYLGMPVLALDAGGVVPEWAAASSNVSLRGSSRCGRPA